MKIDKFNEKYKINTEFKSEISEEYAKMIISKYIDKYDDDVSLQEVYLDIIKGDQLDEFQEAMIIDSLKDFSTELTKFIYKLKTVDEFNVDKYNL